MTDWLELELNVALLSAPDGFHVPIDLLFKKPFHINRHFTPYIAVGPALEARLEDTNSLTGGVTAAAQLTVWPRTCSDSRRRAQRGGRRRTHERERDRQDHSHSPLSRRARAVPTLARRRNAPVVMQHHP